VVLLLSDLLPEMRVMLPEVEAAGARWVDGEPLGPTPACERRSVFSDPSALLQRRFNPPGDTGPTGWTNFGRHSGFSLSAVNTARRASNASSGDTVPSSDGATGGPCGFCGAELRHNFVASRQGSSSIAASGRPGEAWVNFEAGRWWVRFRRRRHGRRARPEAAAFIALKRLEAEADARFV
jgi:hypothetical protein